MSFPFEPADEPRSNSKEDIGGVHGFTRPAPKPVTFPVPAGAPRKECRSCRAPIYWFEHPRTRSRMPLNPDGTSHFSTCPNAASHRGARTLEQQRADQFKFSWLNGVDP